MALPCGSSRGAVLLARSPALFTLWQRALAASARAAQDEASTEARSTDVLIAGAGPTGLVLSSLLSAYGVPSLVVDRGAGPTEHPQVRQDQHKRIVAWNV